MDVQHFFVLVAVLVISFSGVFINLFRKEKNDKIKCTEDENTLLLFRILVPMALLVSVICYFFKLGHFPVAASCVTIGYLVFALGLIIRWVAIISLGQAFTVKVSILEKHTLKTNGIYSYIRHPSYTGLLLYYLALGIIMQNWISFSLLLIFPLVAVINRIRVEEKVLLEHFPSEYEKYQKRSWRLIPFLY
jgi:protein-S-isoprenylcysteine O-methyltransferase Ste14